MNIVDGTASDDLQKAAGLRSDSGLNVDPLVLIDDIEVPRQLEKLYALRSDLRRFLIPAFLLQPETDETRALSDGRVSSLREAHERAGPIARRIDSLATLSPPVDETDRLLRFLYTRSRLDLRPVRDWHDARNYRYPLLDALRDPDTDSRVWLAALQKQELIEPAGAIMDRTRHCRACDSAHLNYVDLCPACGGLQISNINLLHCFGCGYVGDERTFGAVGRRTCVKCARALRHIGIDYDRALQNYTCFDCSSSFAEPKIEARCLNCEREFDPANLNVREVRAWKVARAGRSAVRAGAGFTITDGSLGSIVTVKQFSDLLGWAQRTRQRYPQSQFGLLRIRLDYAGASDAGDLDVDFVQALWQRVRATVRGSEVVGEGGGDSLWVFCPHGDPASLDVLRRRIVSLGDAIDAVRAARVQLRVTSLHSDQIPIDERPESLLELVPRA